MMFQSMSAPVHCCPASHKWTPEPTFNKKKEDSLVMLYPVKKQAMRLLKLQLVFVQKHASLLWANTVQVAFLNNVVSDAFRQNWIDNVLMQSCPRIVDRHYYIGYFHAKQCLCALSWQFTSNFLVQDVFGQHCTEKNLLQWSLNTLWDNFAQVKTLCNVVPEA